MTKIYHENSGSLSVEKFVREGNLPDTKSAWELRNFSLRLPALSGALKKALGLMQNSSVLHGISD